MIKAVENFGLWINACGKLKNEVDLKFSGLNSAGGRGFSSGMNPELMKEPVIALSFYCTKNPEVEKPYGTRDCVGEKGNSKMIVLHCYEVTFVNGQFWQTYLPIQTFSTALGKSSDLTVSGIGHSVIRGLVTNRLMVRREPCYLRTWITVSCANIVQTQMARTLQ